MKCFIPALLLHILDVQGSVDVVHAHFYISIDFFEVYTFTIVLGCHCCFPLILLGCCHVIPLRMLLWWWYGWLL